MIIFKTDSVILKIFLSLLFSQIYFVGLAEGQYHSFFNQHWKIDYSRERGKTDDCMKKGCFKSGDVIAFMSENEIKPGVPVRLNVMDIESKSTIDMNVTVQEVTIEKCQNDHQCMKYFSGTFYDIASQDDPPPARTICISAIRYDDAYYDRRDGEACEGKLLELAENILSRGGAGSEDEISKACDNSNVIYWDVVNGFVESCAEIGPRKFDEPGPVDRPEPGQGTASGPQLPAQGD